VRRQEEERYERSPCGSCAQAARCRDTPPAGSEFTILIFCPRHRAFAFIVEPCYVHRLNFIVRTLFFTQVMEITYARWPGRITVGKKVIYATIECFHPIADVCLSSSPECYAIEAGTPFCLGHTLSINRCSRIGVPPDRAKACCRHRGCRG